MIAVLEPAYPVLPPRLPARGLESTLTVKSSTLGSETLWPLTMSSRLPATNRDSSIRFVVVLKYQTELLQFNLFCTHDEHLTSDTLSSTDAPLHPLPHLQMPPYTFPPSRCSATTTSAGVWRSRQGRRSPVPGATLVNPGPAIPPLASTGDTDDLQVFNFNK